jgi:hypothetical protein
MLPAPLRHRHDHYKKIQNKISQKYSGLQFFIQEKYRFYFETKAQNNISSSLFACITLWVP